MERIGGRACKQYTGASYLCQLLSHAGRSSGHTVRVRPSLRGEPTATRLHMRQRIARDALIAVGANGLAQALTINYILNRVCVNELTTPTRRVAYSR